MPAPIITIFFPCQLSSCYGDSTRTTDTMLHAAYIKDFFATVTSVSRFATVDRHANALECSSQGIRPHQRGPKRQCLDFDNGCDCGQNLPARLIRLRSDRPHCGVASSRSWHKSNPVENVSSEGSHPLTWIKLPARPLVYRFRLD